MTSASWLHMLVNALVWLFFAVAFWLVVALGLSIIIGRSIRNRDTQIPRDTHPAGRRLHAVRPDLAPAEVDRRFAGIVDECAGDTR